jgi:hypothetical protein
MKAYGVSGAIAPPFLTSAVDDGELSASRSWCFTVGEIDTDPLCMGDRLGPRAVLDVTEKRLLMSPGLKPRFFCRRTGSLVAIPNELSRRTSSHNKINILKQVQ